MAKWVKRVSAWLVFGLLCATSYLVGFGAGVVLMIFGVTVHLTTGDVLGIGAAVFLVTFALVLVRGHVAR